MTDFSSVPMAYRFVGGRRHYNAVRRSAAVERRRRLIKLIVRLTRDPQAQVTQRQLAERMGVHEATISRDLGILKMDCGTWRWRAGLGRALGRW